MIRLLFAAFAMTAAGCAYHMGYGDRSLPGGYRQLSIPVFKNKSQETGIEVSFTQALQQEFLRSKVARVVDDPLAELRIEGEIISVDYLPASKVTPKDASARLLPRGTILASQYQIVAVVNVRVVRRSDGETLWQGSFQNSSRSYSAPQVLISGVNSVNPLYNLSARRQNLDLVANEMMLEAHSRLTENF